MTGRVMLHLLTDEAISERIPRRSVDLRDPTVGHRDGERTRIGTIERTRSDMVDSGHAHSLASGYALMVSGPVFE